MGLIVIHPGARSTIQDRGRLGWREVGVGPGGPFDFASHGLANALLANPPECATIEMTALGGKFRAQGPLAVAWAGALMPVAVVREGERLARIPGPGACWLREGDSLEFGGAGSGLRCYLAVAGGWQVPIVLGSRSSEESLRAGDFLPAPCGGNPFFTRRLDDPCPDPAEGPLRIVPGPDAAALPDDGDWGAWRVTNACDRTGLRLEPEGEGSGWADRVAVPEGRLSAPVAPGAIQWTGRQMLILGVACGTMGGYPHIAHVISADLDRLGQARPGDRLDFARVDVAMARRIGRERSNALEARCRVVALFAAT